MKGVYRGNLTGSKKLALHPSGLSVPQRRKISSSAFVGSQQIDLDWDVDPKAYAMLNRV